MNSTQNTTPTTGQNSNVEAHQKASGERQFYAQPYNPSAWGFYFSTAEEFEQKQNEARDMFGEPVEEFEIQFIDGTAEEADLFQACSVHQGNIDLFLSMLDDLASYELPALFYLCGTLGYGMDDAVAKLGDVSIHTGRLEDAAAELFDELYAHDIPEGLRCYIDYSAFAHDCQIGGDMTEFEFAGETYTCTNASGL